MKTIDNLSFKEKRALIRVDYNVPLDSAYNITDTTRIDATILTINKILKDGGSAVLMSHLGRPKGGPEEKYSLIHLIPYLSTIFKIPVKFANDCISEEAFHLSSKLKAGEILLLENLRFYKEEEKGDEAFAGKLARHGDIYVNDAFGTAHRAHASTSVIAKFFPNAKFFGYVMGNEIHNISKVMTGARRPFTAVLGGAKVSGKIQIIQNLMDKVDTLIIGGGMMFTFIKASGGKVGSSLVEEDFIELARKTMQDAESKGIRLVIPTDAIIADAFSNEAQRAYCQSDMIPDNWMGLDIGKNTIHDFSSILLESETILWNGPMGVFEMSNFEEGTRKIAESIADATRKGAFSLVGGGDSVAAINKYNMEEQVSYVSTGGGAMLEYLEGRELPGIKAIME